MTEPGIVVDGVSKVYADGTEAVSDVSLTVGRGELVVLVGPSGCGKSTTLRMVAGLEEVTEGRIEIDGRRVDQLDPKDRDVAMVFQSYALYPHRTAFQNIAYPLKLRRVSKEERTRKVSEIAAMLDLTELLHKRPRHLSGGQRQRVAMGRALVRRPAAFLLDEPLSNLDARLRTDMRAEIKRLHAELGVTTLYVTHDQVEAMTMGDRVVVFRSGRIQQVGRPRDLYASPANVFVATVVGNPAMNLSNGVVCNDGDRPPTLAMGERTIKLDAIELRRNAVERLQDGEDVIVGVRPESIELGGHAEGRLLDGVVALVEDLGSELLVHVDLPMKPLDLVIEEADGDDHPASAQARMRLRTAAAQHPEPGTRIELTVRPSALFLFNPETGAAVGAASDRATVEVS